MMERKKMPEIKKYPAWEDKKSVEDAKAMLADNMDVNLVAKYTGLPVETIELECKNLSV